jgi:hypothetical protein
MIKDDNKPVTIKIYDFVDKKIKSKIKNSKYYCIKFLFEILLENNQMIKEFYKKNGKSQLLFTFFAGTLINNMFHNKDNIMPSYRALIIRTGIWDFNKNTAMEISENHNCGCIVHDINHISCSQDIKRLCFRNINELGKMYIKIYGILELFRKINNLRNYNYKKVFTSVYESTMMMVVYSMITRILLCYQSTTKGYQNIVDFQIATIIGSFAFQFEHDNRKQLLNKYLTGLYIDDITTQYGLNNDYLKYLLLGLIGQNLYRKGFVNTIVQLAF